MTDAVNFESLATGERTVFDSMNVDPNLLPLFDDVLVRGRLQMTDPDIDIVVERLHDPNDPGSIVEGALLYLLQDRKSQEIVSGSMVCWDAAVSEEAWNFAQHLQRASNVVCCGGQGAPPTLPWSAGLSTQSFHKQNKRDRAEIAAWERAICLCLLRAAGQINSASRPSGRAH